MSQKKDARKAEPPVIDTPRNNDTTGVRFQVTGTGTPGNVVQAYSAKDSLNPLFGQRIAESGKWTTFLDLSKFGFYVVEKDSDGVVSLPSPVVNVNLGPIIAAPHGEGPIDGDSQT